MAELNDCFNRIIQRMRTMPCADWACGEYPAEAFQLIEEATGFVANDSVTDLVGLLMKEVERLNNTLEYIRDMGQESAGVDPANFYRHGMRAMVGVAHRALEYKP